MRDQLAGFVGPLVDRGIGRIVRLFGEAGIGKTTLVDEVRVELERYGVQCWIARSAALDAVTPFAAIASAMSSDGEQMLSGAVATRAALAASQSGLGTQTLTVEGARFETLDRIVEEVESRCQAPCVLVVEDLHWADSASLDALALVAASALDHPLLLILTHRPSIQNHELGRLIAEVDRMGGESLAIQPLNAAEIDMLVRELCGGDPSPELLERASGAAGNPFLVNELVDGLLAEGGLVKRDQQLHVDAADLPQQLQRAIASELSGLGEDVRSVVQAASVHGNEVVVRDLAAMLGASPIQLAASVEAALDARLLVERESRLVFRHDLVRDAVYQQMPRTVRQAAHRELASALASRSASPALVASHLLLADGDRAETLSGLLAAASETSALAPESALGFLNRALELSESDLDLRRVLEQARLEALTAAGSLDEAENVAHWLLTVSPAGDHAELRARLAGLALIAGEGERALVFADEASVGAPTEDKRSTYLALGAVICAANRDYLRAWTMANEAIEVGERVHSTVGPSIGTALVARVMTYGKDVEQGLQLGAKAVALADADETGEAHSAVPCVQYGIMAHDLDRLGLADEMVARGVTLAASHRMMWSVPLYEALAAACHLRRGDLDLAGAEAESSIEMAERIRSRQGLAWAQSVLALVSIEVSDLADAKAWADAAVQSWESGSASFGAEFVALGAARVKRVQGSTQEAFDGLCVAWENFAAVGLDFCHPVLATDLATMAIELGDTEWLDRTIASVTAVAEATQVSASLAQAKWLVALRDRDGAQARSALARLRTTERALEVGYWMVTAPELVSVDGNPEPVLREALVIFETRGAARSATATRAALDVLGEPMGGSQDEWSTLTPTETTIVKLLAEGLTNAEIAQRRGSSRRTVESHLRRAYSKLGIEGRARLTVVAAERFRSPGAADGNPT